MVFTSHLPRRFPRRFGALMISGGLAASVAGVAWTSPAHAATNTVGPINFETGYDLGNINGQNGWSKTGAYDVEVADVSAFPAAADYGFGTMALRASNATTSSGFGDHTFSPGLNAAAGEGAALPYYTGGFEIGAAVADEQAGLSMSVSPDDGTGGRMSYLRFDDEADGVHVTFGDSVNAGPLNTTTEWRYTDIATLSRTTSHSIRFEINFVEGPANDVVKVFVDGALAHTGTTWEDYYRFSSEQKTQLNAIPPTSKLLFIFRTSSGAAPDAAGEGYLVDGVNLTSGDTAPVPSAPPTAPSVNYDGNQNCADFNSAWEEFKIEGVPDEGIHDDPKSGLVITISNSSPQTFDWASNQDLSAVLVKGGSRGGGVKYAYSGPNDLGDTGLHALLHDEDNESPYYGISHVTFCYQVGGDTQPPVDETVTPQTETQNPGNPNPGNPNPGNPNPGNPNPGNPSGNPQAGNPSGNPQAAVQPGAEVLGVLLTEDATLPRTGTPLTRPLALAGGLGVTLGLAMLLLASRRTPVENR